MASTDRKRAKSARNKKRTTSGGLRAAVKSGRQRRLKSSGRLELNPEGGSGRQKKGASGRLELQQPEGGSDRRRGASGRAKKRGSTRIKISGGSSADRRLAKAALELGLADAAEIGEALRIVDLRASIDERTTLDRLLFEQDVLSAAKVRKLQARAKVQTAFCPGCGEGQDVFGTKPGARLRCGSCKAKHRAPGLDPSDPFAAGAAGGASGRAPAAERESRGLVAFGLLALLAVGAGLGDAVASTFSTHLRWPALAALGVFAAAVALLGRGRRFAAAAGVGLAAYTGLVIAAAIGNAPGTTALSSLGLDAHRLVPPLVLLHGVLLVVLARPLVDRLPTWLTVGLAAPALYGLVFFVLRSVPGAPAGHLFRGPGPLADLPWWGQPGAVLLLFLFPLGALVLLARGVTRGQRLLRTGGLAVGLLLLAGFGLAAGALQGELPAPGVRDRVEDTLAGRVADFWREPGAAGAEAPEAAAPAGAEAGGSVAPALTEAEEGAAGAR